MADTKIIGIVLAGGRAERLGGHGKAQIKFGEGTLMARAIDRLRPQCSQLILSLNEPLAGYGDFVVVRDPAQQRLGPLAGILAGLEWIAEHAPDTSLMASAPVDGPFLPKDFVARLQNARSMHDADIACAASSGRRHGVYGLWPVSLAADLRTSLLENGIRKVDLYLSRHRVAMHDWPADTTDPFFNINTPDDLAEAHDVASRYPQL